jgi:predicted ester cyclase
VRDTGKFYFFNCERFGTVLAPARCNRSAHEYALNANGGVRGLDMHSTKIPMKTHDPKRGDRMSIEGNKQVIREFTRVFKNDHNVDGIDHLFASDFKHNFRAPLPDGLAGLKDVGRMMNGAFPDVVVTELDLIAADDTVVERSSARATNTGGFQGRPSSNLPCQWSEIHIYRMRNGKIIEHWAEVSMLELMMQIGAVKPA